MPLVQFQWSDPVADPEAVLDDVDDFDHTELEICHIDEGSDDDGGTSHGGDTVASATDLDIANGDLTAVAARNAQCTKARAKAKDGRIQAPDDRIIESQ